MRENATAHTANVIKQSLYHNHIKAIPLPACALDLNPTKNLGIILLRKFIKIYANFRILVIRFKQFLMFGAKSPTTRHINLVRQ